MTQLGNPNGDIYIISTSKMNDGGYAEAPYNTFLDCIPLEWQCHTHGKWPKKFFLIEQSIVSHKVYLQGISKVISRSPCWFVLWHPCCRDCQKGRAFCNCCWLRMVVFHTLCLFKPKGTCMQLTWTKWVKWQDCWQIPPCSAIQLFCNYTLRHHCCWTWMNSHWLMANQRLMRSPSWTFCTVFIARHSGINYVFPLPCISSVFSIGKHPSQILTHIFSGKLSREKAYKDNLRVVSRPSQQSFFPLCHTHALELQMHYPEVISNYTVCNALLRTMLLVLHRSVWFSWDV